MDDSTPFTVLRRSFRLLARGPHQPVLDLSDVPGAGLASMSAGELDGWLLRAPREIADEVWRRLLAHVRTKEAAWTVVAAGLALPGLCAARTRLSRGLGEERADLEAEMLAALVAEMRILDLGPAGVCGRLVYAARKAGQRHRYAIERARRRELLWEPEQAPSQDGARGPVTLLAHALRTGALSRVEAELIARTFLEHTPLTRVAEELGLSYITARRYRRRAQDRLAAIFTEEKNAA